MNLFSKATLGAIAAAALITAQSASATLTFSEDFESKTAGQNPIGSGFVIGNVNETTGGQWFGGLPAPGGVNAWSDIVDDQGGAGQGMRQLSIYPDFNNGDRSSGHTIQDLVYRDMGLVDAADVGLDYVFSFDAKLGNIVDSTAGADHYAYIQVLKQSDGSFGVVGEQQLNSTSLPVDLSWSGGALALTVTPDMVGELLQIGFSTTTTGFDSGGVFYDNLNVAAVPLPAGVWLFGSALLGLVGIGRKRRA